MAQVEKYFEKIDQAILDCVAQDVDLTARFDSLTSIPGISIVTAISMLIEMPELEEMGGKPAACESLSSSQTRFSETDGNDRKNTLDQHGYYLVATSGVPEAHSILGYDKFTILAHNAFSPNRLKPSGSSLSCHLLFAN